MVSTGAGYFIALKSNGSIWGSGYNQNGELGLGNNNNINTLTKIGNALNWKDVFIKGFTSFALKTDGTFWSSGDNQFGQLGDGTLIDKNQFTQIGIDNDWIKVESGNTPLALKSNGTLWSWGRNDFYQIGDGTNIMKTSPIQIGSDRDWSDISVSDYNSIAIKIDGSLWAWGRNNFGQVGDSTKIDKKEPVKIGYENNWVSVSAGGDHVLALKKTTAKYLLSGQLQSSIPSITFTDIKVQINGNTSKSISPDASGKFVFNNLSSGTYTISSSYKDFYFQPNKTEVVITNSNVNNINFGAYQKNSFADCIIMNDTTLQNVYYSRIAPTAVRGSVIIQNKCNYEVDISNIEILQSNGNFKVTNALATYPLTIDALGTYMINVEFIPKKAGLDSALFRLTVDGKFVNAYVRANAIDVGDTLPISRLSLRSNKSAVYPGDPVELYLIVDSVYNYKLTEKDNFDFSFSIKTNICADLDTIATPNILKFRTTYPYTGIIHPSKNDYEGNTLVKLLGQYQYVMRDTLAKFQFTATLGSTDSVLVFIDNFEWKNSGIKANFYIDGVIRIIPCEAGGERLVVVRRVPKVKLMSISPNPSSEDITLRINSNDEIKNSEIEIFNVLGMSLLKSNFIINKGDSELKLDLKNIPSGFYTIRLNKDIQSVFFKE